MKITCESLVDGYNTIDTSTIPLLWQMQPGRRQGEASGILL